MYYTGQILCFYSGTFSQVYLFISQYYEQEPLKPELCVTQEENILGQQH